jgi:hypothetical protein
MRWSLRPLFSPKAALVATRYKDSAYDGTMAKYCWRMSESDMSQYSVYETRWEGERRRQYATETAHTTSTSRRSDDDVLL